MTRTPLLISLIFGLTSFPLFALEPISKEGHSLAEVLNSMDVEKHWIAGGIVDWRTGDPTGKAVTDTGKHTHCSQFVAATAERLGVYILRPPEHSPVLLANAQFDWLSSQGKEQGWIPVKNGVSAQDEANRGSLVVAVYKNQDPTKSGHIAIVRPDQKSPEEIAKDGPTVIQAGGHNYNQTTLRKGFANHSKGYAESLFARGVRWLF